MTHARLKWAVVPAFLLLVLLGWFGPAMFREWGLFPLLGVFPGVALATLLPIERNALARWTLGVAISPLIAGALAWGLMVAGVPLALAARVVATLGTLLWVWTELRVVDRPARPGMRFAWRWALGSAFVIAFVLFVNPYLKVRADAWVHGGIVWEILTRGIPPQDPRFAGLLLNYVWFYNFFIALLATLRGGDPFSLMAISNTGMMFVTMALAWLIGRDLWKSSRAGAGAAILMGLTLNAGMWLLWPVRLLRALTGVVRGNAEIARVLATTHWNTAEVIYDLSAPYSLMINFLDKPLHGTAINVAYALMLLYLWAMIRTLRGDRVAGPIWGGVAACGMLLFHGVVGLSVIPVSLGALGLTWLLTWRVAWLPARSRLVLFAVATALGSALAAPYTIAISKAWPAAQTGLHQKFLRGDPEMWITLVTALLVPAWFARHSVRRLVAERRGPAAVIAFWVVGMTAFACVVTLPIGSHAKFVFQVFAGLVVLGGVAFHGEIAAWQRRFGPFGAGLLIAIVLLAAPVLTIRGYLLDRTVRTAPEENPAPGETALYDWIAHTTPANAVFVDNEYRNIIMVWGKRQLYLGSSLGPDLAAFPLDETLTRRAVMADLYGDADSLERDASELKALGRPAYVLVRPGDLFPFGSPAVHLEARQDLFTRVRDQDGFTVLQVR